MEFLATVVVGAVTWLIATGIRGTGEPEPLSEAEIDRIPGAISKSQADRAAYVAARDARRLQRATDPAHAESKGQSKP